MRMNWRTPLCDRLGIAHPIFGFSHSVDVVVEIARAGGYPVLGLAREMPHEIPEILRAVDERMNGMPYGVDLMLPSQVPQSGDIAQVRAALPRQHLGFVAGLRQKFAVPAPVKPSFFTTQVRSQELFESQIEQVLASNANGVATAIGLREDLIVRVDVLVAQGYDAGGHTGVVGTYSLVPQIVAVAGDTPVLAAGASRGDAGGRRTFAEFRPRHRLSATRLRLSL
jgi:NAD(P)H-dependent flavin oxidoreductase YrpB (nitropropane dioxygenase family)